MKIESSSHIAAANERFNHFHDGYLRRIALTRDTDLFDADAVGGRQELERLWKNGTTIEIEILHSNYSDSNQPKNRLVKIRANACVHVAENIERFLGKNLIDLQFGKHPQGVECLFLQPTKGELAVGMESGAHISLFVAESVQIEEATFT
jgi:hypothetical protein